MSLNKDKLISYVKPWIDSFKALFNNIVIRILIILFIFIYLFTLHDYKVVYKSKMEHVSSSGAGDTRMNFYECVIHFEGIAGVSGATVIYTNYVTGETKEIRFGPYEKIDRDVEIGKIKKYRHGKSIGFELKEGAGSSIYAEIRGRSYGIDYVDNFLYNLIFSAILSLSPIS